MKNLIELDEGLGIKHERRKAVVNLKEIIKTETKFINDFRVLYPRLRSDKSKDIVSEFANACKKRIFKAKEGIRPAVLCQDFAELKDIYDKHILSKDHSVASMQTVIWILMEGQGKLR